MSKKPVKKKRSRRPGAAPASRLRAFALDNLSPEQHALVEAIKSGPRGRFHNEGPFAVYLHSPGYGKLAQALGGYLRYHTSLPPRLKEFAILCTARHWKAQYEWHAHAPMAENDGVKPNAIRDLRAGRPAKSAAKDELAIYEFVKQIYAKRRVSNAAYARVHKLIGDSGMVELVGILGYYALISMTLNVFRMPLPEGASAPFPEPRV
jgi:4-carboxymuconolactone decarboxylase